MNGEDLDCKFVANCEPVIGRERTAALGKAVWWVDRADSVADLWKRV